MNDFAKRWVEALRSGKYEQGRGYLKEGNKFCAFGVACELIRDKLHIATYRGITRYDNSNVIAPSRVRIALGMDRTNSTGYFVDSNGYTNSIILLSDSDVPFTEIADLIEQYQSQLFRE